MLNPKLLGLLFFDFFLIIYTYYLNSFLLLVMDQFQTAFSELQALVQSQQQEIQHLQAICQVSQLAVARPVTRPKPALPDSEKFAGSS
jgi:hypothetical protein